MYRIMMVDDDPTSLAIGKALLEPTYKIILMKSGIQALGYLKNNPIPDIILLDMVMPGTSGLDVLKALKDDEDFINVPVIFLSDIDDVKMEIEGLLLGAVDFIQKPVNPALLRKKVQYQIAHIEMEKENREMRQRIQELENMIRQSASILQHALPGNH